MVLLLCWLATNCWCTLPRLLLGAAILSRRQLASYLFDLRFRLAAYC